MCLLCCWALLQLRRPLCTTPCVHFVRLLQLKWRPVWVCLPLATSPSRVFWPSYFAFALCTKCLNFWRTAQLQLLPCVFSMCADLCLRHSSATAHSKPNSLFRGVLLFVFLFSETDQKYVCALRWVLKQIGKKDKLPVHLFKQEYINLCAWLLLSVNSYRLVAKGKTCLNLTITLNTWMRVQTKRVNWVTSCLTTYTKRRDSPVDSPSQNQIPGQFIEIVDKKEWNLSFDCFHVKWKSWAGPIHCSFRYERFNAKVP